MNIAKTLTILIVLIAVVIAAVYLLGQFPQTKPFYDQIMTFIQPAKDFVQTPTGAITALGGIGSVASIAGLVSKLSSAKQQLTQVTNTASAELKKVTDAKDKVLSEVEGYKKQATDATDELTKTKDELTKLKASIGDPQSEINKAQAQVEAIKSQNTEFVKQLMSAANGAIVANPLDGKTYSVLKVTQQIVT